MCPLEHTPLKHAQSTRHPTAPWREAVLLGGVFPRDEWSSADFAARSVHAGRYASSSVDECHDPCRVTAPSAPVASEFGSILSLLLSLLFTLATLSKRAQLRPLRHPLPPHLLLTPPRPIDRAGQPGFLLLSVDRVKPSAHFSPCHSL